MIPLATAQAWLTRQTRCLPPETVPLNEAQARALATPIVATALPPHATALIDGLALRAAGTEGAIDYAPLPVEGTQVVAGAFMPSGADAILPPHLHDQGPVALSAIARGHGVAPPGHDASAAWTLPVGTILHPLHLALLAALGHPTIQVTRRPRVGLRIAPPKHGHDALNILLQALLTPCATLAVPPDLILLAGRSGPGPDDDAIAALTTVEAHGIAIRPGESTAIGHIGSTPAILLPGHPLACATTFALLVAPALRRMAGLPEPTPIAATLTRKITSALGQLDAILVRCEAGDATPLAPAEHGSLHRALEADGMVLVPEGSEGYPAGATIQVHPL